ncbi:MAG: type III pantothenate kinase [Clostridiales bacterium]|nr:type III pantothenate kinase [Clostridiales bacterium]
MILAFDIGNTNILIGGFEGNKVCFQCRISTSLDKTEAEYAVLIKNLFDLYEIKATQVEGSIIASVVPPLVNIIRGVMLRLTGCKPMIVGPGLKTGLKITIGDPSELGADLVVTAVAALKKYPKPIIILDMGTATTFSVINKNSDFLGVVIYPGVMISFDALTARTAQLPRISFDEPRQLIGTNSIDSMQSGLIYGNAAMVDGICDRIEAELGEKATVLATGGLSGSIVPHCRREIIVDDDLLLEGLRILYEKNKK